MLLPQLQQRGASRPAAADFVVRLAANSDEQIEAWFADGRSWVMICGSAICPGFLDRETVIETAHDQAAALTAAGLSIIALDVADLFADVSEMARAAVKALAETN